MLECTSIIINSFHLFQRTLFNKEFVGEGIGGPQSVIENKQGEGRGQVHLYAHSVKRIARFFKQQIEFLLISCLAVAESLIKKA